MEAPRGVVGWRLDLEPGLLQQEEARETLDGLALASLVTLVGIRLRV